MIENKKPFQQPKAQRKGQVTTATSANGKLKTLKIASSCNN
jgi:hypothetical protein